jgi:hypothetical protein
MRQGRHLAGMSDWRHLVLGVLTVALVLGAVGVAFAGTVGEDGAAADRGWRDEGNADASRVTWNGLNWDIVGYNTPDAEHGIIGPEGTVTLLLDETSYNSSMRTAFWLGSPWNTYAGSKLQTKLASMWAGFRDKSGVTPRTLTGGSAPSSAVDGYDDSSVRGPTVADQPLWLLSVGEASQLKASVRSYGDVWWLRSPGYTTGTTAQLAGDFAWVDDDGEVVADGRELSCYTELGPRPAVYLSISTPVFTSILQHMVSGALKIGAYDATVRATDALGRAWDVAGVNDGSASRGVSTPEGYATLLLSNGSPKKFEGLNERSFVTQYPTSNNYVNSNLPAALSSAYDDLSSEDQYRGYVLARSLAGGSGAYGTDTYQPDRVLGESALEQRMWPLSVTEAESLLNQQRIYGAHAYGYNGWYLRTPGEGTDWIAGVDTDGVIDAGRGSYVWNSAAVRPAMYVRLDSPLFAGLPPEWAKRVGIATGGGLKLVDDAEAKHFSQTTTPRILGKAKVGKKLWVIFSSWKPEPKYSYQWYRCKANGTSWKAISRATKSTYKLTTSDKNKKIKVKVTARKSGYKTVSRTSKATTKVKK